MLDVLHPLVLLVRGLGRLAVRAAEWWRRTPRERRSPTLFLVAASLVVVALAPYGLVLGLVSLMATAAWYGRERAEPLGRLSRSEAARLRNLYEALVPYFSAWEQLEQPGDRPLYAPGGEWRQAVDECDFAEDGRIVRLRLRYPASFRAGEVEDRVCIERLLVAECGCAQEFRFRWDGRSDRLEMVALAPLRTDVHAQRFVTAPGQTVLGITDAGAAPSPMPVAVGNPAERGTPGRGEGESEAARMCQLPPVVWRTGARSSETHLLAVGLPGAGTSTLLRSVAVQAVERGEVLVVGGDGGAGFRFLAGRRGVLGVESSPVGVGAALEWLAQETERRLTEVSRARRAGKQVPPEVRHPLWLVVDRPAALSRLARAEGRRDPLELLEVPLRHGRMASVTVAVAERFEGVEELGAAVFSHTSVRLVLGAVVPEWAGAVLGEAPPTSPVPQLPAGRGFVRLGGGPVTRLQVPATPDPFDSSAGGVAQREAVLALLPEWDADASDSAGPKTAGGAAGAWPGADQAM